jgi:hypothetical protein
MLPTVSVPSSVPSDDDDGAEALPRRLNVMLDNPSGIQPFIVEFPKPMSVDGQTVALAIF